MMPLHKLVPTCLSLLLALPACQSEVDDAPTNPSDTADSHQSASDVTNNASQAPPDFACEVPQPFPYPESSPYVGIHANAQNNDLVPCTTSERFETRWHALQGRAIAQPNTFSPDGLTTYVTTSQPREGDCNLFALSTKDGSEQWCRDVGDGAIWSAVEVDLDGNLFLSGGAQIHSYGSSGDPRWAVTVPDDTGVRAGAIGLHFTPDGHIASITNQGTVFLLSRSDGSLLASINIPKEYGFVPAGSLGLDVNLTSLFPEKILTDFQSLQYGSPGNLLKTFSGDGNFSDNTLAVAPDGTLYTVGGGPSAEAGALVQIKVGGTAELPELVAGWYLETVKSSASSPNISPDGSMVKMTDGSGPLTVLDLGPGDATTRLVDVAACDANTDSDPAVERCGELYSVVLATGPTMGTTPLLNDGVHYAYEVQIADLFNDVDADLRAYQGDTTVWETLLPDNLQWTSVITVTLNHLVGTATRFTPSDEVLLSIELPSTAASELIVVDRESGEVVFRAPITDDSTSTVTVGPDGSLYVTMLCLLHNFSLETRPIGGVIAFAPTE